MSKHTDGPWHKGAGNGAGSIFKDGDGRMRLEQGGTTLYPIASIVTGWDEAEDEANGALIAAAPELLEALNALLLWANDEKKCRRQWGGLEHTKIINQAKDAISKAKGY